MDYSDRLLTTLDRNGVAAIALDQNHLNESAGLLGAPGSLDLTYYYWNGGTSSGYAPTNGAPIDWNGNGRFETDVCKDISNNEPAGACGSLPVLQPSNDWLSHISGAATVFDNLQFQYQCTAGYAKSSPTSSNPEIARSPRQ